MQRILNQRHSTSTWVNATSILFERASYYGIRAIIVLYLIDGTFKMTTEEALIMFGWFTISIVFAKIIGALLGDFLLGNRKTLIIGGLLQAAGTFVFCVPSLNGVYFGFTLFIIGNGFYSSNMIAYFGKQYYGKMKLLDAGYTIYYLASNLGSFVGVLLIGYLGERIGWNIGFIAAGILLLISVSLPLLFRQNEQEKIPLETNAKKGMALNLSIAFVLVAIFWYIFQFIEISKAPLLYHFSGRGTSSISSYLGASEPSLIMLIILIFFIILWSKYYTSQLVKLLMGFVFTALSIGILLVIPESPSENHTIPFIIFLVFTSLSEIFISPILNSLLTQYVNKKYLTTVLSLSFLPTGLFIILMNYLIGFFFDHQTILVVILLVIVLAIIIGLFLFIKKFGLDRTMETNSRQLKP